MAPAGAGRGRRARRRRGDTGGVVRVVGLLGDGVEAERGGAAQELALPAHHVRRLRGRGLVGQGDDPSGGHVCSPMEWMIDRYLVLE